MPLSPRACVNSQKYGVDKLKSRELDDIIGIIWTGGSQSLDCKIAITKN